MDMVKLAEISYCVSSEPEGHWPRSTPSLSKHVWLSLHVYKTSIMPKAYSWPLILLGSVGNYDLSACEPCKRCYFLADQ